MSEEEALANLTAEQARIISDESWYGRSGWKIDRPRKSLERLGITLNGRSYLSPLGIAVRSLIMKGDTHEQG